MRLCTLHRDRSGSMVVEAAIVIPVFLALILSFIAWIKLASTDIALQTAASESVKQIAAHYALLEPLEETSQNVWAKGKSDLLSLLPEGWLNAVDQLEAAQFNDVEAAAAARTKVMVLKPLAKKLLTRYADKQLLQPDSLSISKLELSGAGLNEFIAMQVEYQYALTLPFIEKKIVLQKNVIERVWTGDGGI